MHREITTLLDQKTGLANEERRRMAAADEDLRAVERQLSEATSKEDELLRQKARGVGEGGGENGGREGGGRVRNFRSILGEF